MEATSTNAAVRFFPIFLPHAIHKHPMVAGPPPSHGGRAPPRPVQPVYWREREDRDDALVNDQDQGGYGRCEEAHHGSF
jgi:hypothetical protein